MKRKLLSLILAASMFMGTATDVYAVSDIAVTAESLVVDQDELSIDLEDDAEYSSEDSSEDDASEDSFITVEDGEEDASSELSSDEEFIDVVDESTDESSDESSEESSEDASDESDVASSEESVDLDSIILNYHDIEQDEHLESVLDGLEDSESYDAIMNDTYPARYITPNLPSLRDQNPYGSCWAHSLMALAEISLIKKGLVSGPNLSEVHTAYFTYHSVTDPLGGTAGDSNALTSRYASNYLNAGGNIALGANVLASWTGAADESVAPYSKAASYIRNGLSSSLAYKDKAHMINYYEQTYSTSTSGLNAVKKLINDYGAVGVSYYQVDLDREDFPNIYNSANNCYYNPKKPYGTNHAVTIVGWDDNFSKAKFTNQPKGNGAWLIRNSWTTGNSYSLYGYFWMSYYEPSIGDTIMAMEYGLSNNYANNYQYDGSMYPQSIAANNAKYANVFTAHSGSATESLQAVSFQTPTSNTKYTIKVYKNVNTTNPESGSCVATVSGSKSYAGYYTIPLSKPITLNKGTRFSVVITLAKSNGDMAYMGCEYTASSSWFDIKCSISKGQSFIYYNNSWKDMVSTGNGNLRIKAFTNNSGSPTPVDPPAPGVVSVTLDPNGSNAKVKTVKMMNGVYSALPTKLSRTGYTFQGWYTAKTGGKKVNNGDALANKADHTLYARWAANRYTLEFNANGGSGSMKAQTLSYNQVISTPKSTFSRYGYSFKGWSKSKSGDPLYKKTTVKNLSTKNGGKVTFYAQWKVLSYKVTFDSLGGTKVAAKTVKFNTKKKVFGSVKKPATPTRKGYTFVNWYTDKNFKNVYNFNSQVKGNITLYAKWTPNTYTVTFKAPGATGSMGTMKCTYNKPYSFPKLGYSKYGYNFKGWSKSKDGGKVLTNINNLSSKKDGKVTLYAQWSVWTHTVTFNSKGGSAVKAKTVKFVPSKKVWGKVSKPTAPTRKGFKFNGWYTDSKCTKAYDFKQPVSKNITLYAGWKKSANK